MVAAGYVLYSSSVVMMLSVGSGVYGFTLDPNYGEFIMSHVRLLLVVLPCMPYLLTWIGLLWKINCTRTIVSINIYIFTLHFSLFSFLAFTPQDKLMIPKEPKKIYSINCGNFELWDQATKSFVTWANTQKSPYSLRYIGSMVSDVHR